MTGSLAETDGDISACTTFGRDVGAFVLADDARPQFQVRQPRCSRTGPPAFIRLRVFRQERRREGWYGAAPPQTGFGGLIVSTLPRTDLKTALRMSGTLSIFVYVKG